VESVGVVYILIRIFIHEPDQALFEVSRGLYFFHITSPAAFSADGQMDVGVGESRQHAASIGVDTLNFLLHRAGEISTDKYDPAVGYGYVHWMRRLGVLQREACVADDQVCALVRRTGRQTRLKGGRVGRQGGDVRYQTDRVGALGAHVFQTISDMGVGSEKTVHGRLLC
jgi:hypothetical protein